MNDPEITILNSKFLMFQPKGKYQEAFFYALKKTEDSENNNQYEVQFPNTHSEEQALVNLLLKKRIYQYNCIHFFKNKASTADKIITPNIESLETMAELIHEVSNKNRLFIP